VVFPILLNELILYRPNLEPGARCACHLRIRDLQPRQLRADMDIIGPDGKLWMQVIGWTDWRFSWPKAFYDFWRFPNRGFVSRRIDVPLPEGNEDAECCGLETFGELASGIWENLWAHLIMSRRELAQYHSITPAGRRTEWIFGRAAAKEAVRRWVKRHYDADLYPADVEITTDEQGKPVVTGRWTERCGGAPHVSISHKGARAVAVAGRHPLGIDLEKIEARDGSFEGAAFDERERGLLDQLNGIDRNEWVTRLWSAKEAASKANGHGLDRGPGTMVVRSVDPTAGRLVVTGGNLPGNGPVAGSPGNGEDEFEVHTVCDGGFVVAVAAGKRKNA
jgi:phosphopantetheinyl transferase (holo-ACP synthase)